MNRVLVVTERYWPDGSGGELATHLIVGLLRRRYEVVVVTGSSRVERHPRVSYVYEPLLSRREKIFLWPNVARLARSDRFQRLLRSADVVYVPRFSFPVIPYAKRLGKRVVVHLHDYIPISYTSVVLAPYEEHKGRIARDDISLECMKGPRRCAAAAVTWWMPRLARRWIAQADKIICVSRRQESVILDAMPELRGKTTVVYNPLPEEYASVDPSKEPSEIPTFLYVGGDSYIKGFDVLLQAVKMLDKEKVKAKLVLTNRYGEKALSRLRDLAQKLSHVSIDVIGRIDYGKLAELHRHAWALLFPSIWEEPLPYAVVEAVALGTIPIASRVGGVPEIVEKEGVRYLFTPQNVKELTSKIAEVITLSPSDVVKIGFFLRKNLLTKLSKETNDITKIFS